jgi:hypothetical protein
MTTRPTDMAGFRGIGRVYQYDCDSSILGLIGDELPKLVEGPRGMPIPLHFADMGPLSDPGQIFQSNVLLADACGLDNASTDAVVDRVHMPSLPSREAFQGALGAFRPFGLERAADFGVVGTEPFDFGRVVWHAVGIDRHTAPPEINAQGTSGLLWPGALALDLHVYEERAIPALHEGRTGGRLAFEPSLLPGAKHRLQALSAGKQGQAEGPVPFPETEDALIVVDRGRIEGRMGFRLDLEGGTDTGNGTNRQIGRQAEALPHLAVACVLDLHLVGRVDLPDHVGNVVAGIRKGTQGRVQFGALHGSGEKLAGYGSYRFHRREYIPLIYQPESVALEARPIFPLLGLKPRGFQIGAFYEKSVYGNKWQRLARKRALS